MSITVTLDSDVIEKVKAESRSRGVSVDGTINELLRIALAVRATDARKPFIIEPFRGSGPPRINIDCTAKLLEELEGPDAR